MEQGAILAGDKFDGRKRSIVSPVMTPRKLGVYFLALLFVPLAYMVPLLYGLASDGGVATGACFVNTCRPQGANGTVLLNMTVDVYPPGTGRGARGGVGLLHANLTYDSAGLTRPGEGPFAVPQEGEVACAGLIKGGAPFACAFTAYPTIKPRVAYPAKSQVDTSAGQTAMLVAMVVLGVAMAVEALWWALGIPPLDHFTGSEEVASLLPHTLNAPSQEQLENPKEEVSWVAASYMPFFFNIGMVALVIFLVNPLVFAMLLFTWAGMRSFPITLIRQMVIGIVSTGKVGSSIQRTDWVSATSSARSWLTICRMHQASRNWEAPETVPEGHSAKAEQTIQDFVPSISHPNFKTTKSYPLWLRAMEHADDTEEGGAQEALEYELERTYSPSPDALRLRQKLYMCAAIALCLTSGTALGLTTTPKQEFVVVDRMIIPEEVGAFSYGVVWVLEQAQLETLEGMLAHHPEDLLDAPRPIKDLDGEDSDGTDQSWQQRWALNAKVQCAHPWAGHACGSGLLLNMVKRIGCALGFVTALLGAAYHYNLLKVMERLPVRPSRAQRRHLATLLPGGAFKEMSFIVGSGIYLNTSQLPLAALMALSLIIPNGGGAGIGFVAYVLMWFMTGMLSPVRYLVYTVGPQGIECQTVGIGAKKCEKIQWDEFLGFEKHWYSNSWKAHSKDGESPMWPDIGPEAIVFLLAGARAAGAQEYYVPKGKDPLPPLAIGRSAPPADAAAGADRDYGAHGDFSSAQPTLNPNDPTEPFLQAYESSGATPGSYNNL